MFDFDPKIRPSRHYLPKSLVVSHKKPNFAAMIQSIATSMPMIVCGILTAQLGLSLYDRWDRPRFRLLIFMATATLLYTAHCIFFNNLTQAIPFSDTLYSFCNPAVYPLYYLYIEELTLHRPNRWRQFLMLVPSIVCFLAVGLLYLLMSGAETTAFIRGHLYQDEYSTLTGLAWWQAQAHLIVKIVFALQIPPILIMGWRHITRYNTMVEQNYSDTEDKTLAPIKSLLVFFVITTLVSFLCNIIGRYRFADSPWLLTVPSATFSLLILLIGHLGLRQNFYIRDIAEAVDKPEPTAGATPKEDMALRERLRYVIDTEKIYLQPNLKLEDLANRLNSNRNYMYNVINVEMGISFSEYINQKRIEYAAQQIRRNPKALLTDIATASGFTSTSAFYRNFKQFKHCTPSQFQREALESQ